MGTSGRKPKRKEIVWSSNLAYAIGLIASDGNLSPDGRHLLFVSKDLEQVINLKEALNLSVKLGKAYPGKKFAHKEYYRIQWGDVTLYNFLLSIGLSPNKSLTIGSLSIPDEYFFDFLRGAFDGDGCFYSYFDPRWGNSYMFYLQFISASNAHIDWLQDTIYRLVKVQGHRTRVATGEGMSTLRYAKHDTLILLKYLYPNIEIPHLTRKRLKIEAALRIVGLPLISTDKVRPRW